MRHLSNSGEVFYKQHPLFTSAEMCNSAFYVDLGYVGYRPLSDSDTDIQPMIQLPDADKRKDQWLTECGFEFRFPEANLYVENLGGITLARVMASLAKTAVTPYPAGDIASSEWASPGKGNRGVYTRRCKVVLQWAGHGDELDSGGGVRVYAAAELQPAGGHHGGEVDSGGDRSDTQYCAVGWRSGRVLQDITSAESYITVEGIVRGTHLNNKNEHKKGKVMAEKYSKSVGDWNPGPGKKKASEKADELMSTEASDAKDTMTGTNSSSSGLAAAEPARPYGTQGRKF